MGWLPTTMIALFNNNKAMAVNYTQLLLLFRWCTSHYRTLAAQGKGGDNADKNAKYSPIDSRKSAKKRVPKNPLFIGYGGERGIRTLDTGLSPYTRLAGELLRPTRTSLRGVQRVFQAMLTHSKAYRTCSVTLSRLQCSCQVREALSSA